MCASIHIKLIMPKTDPYITLRALLTIAFVIISKCKLEQRFLLIYAKSVCTEIISWVFGVCAYIVYIWLTENESITMSHIDMPKSTSLKLPIQRASSRSVLDVAAAAAASTLLVFASFFFFFCAPHRYFSASHFHPSALHLYFIPHGTHSGAERYLGRGCWWIEAFSLTLTCATVTHRWSSRFPVRECVRSCHYRVRVEESSVRG